MKPSEIKREIKSVSEAINLSDLGLSVMSDLEALFVAIKDANNDKHKVNKLAGIGQYLTEDWSNLFDCMSADLKELKKKAQ